MQRKKKKKSEFFNAYKAAATLEEHPSDGGSVEDSYYSLPNSSQGANLTTTPAKKESQSYEALDITRVDYISVYSVSNELKNKT